MKYIVESSVKKLAKEHGKRVSREFLIALDKVIFDKVCAACKTWNGGRVTLTAAMLERRKNV